MYGKSRKGLQKSIMLAAMCAVFIVPETASANEWVRFLEGTWVGSGSGRVSPDDNPQKIRCRLKGLSESEVRLSFDGRCASTKRRGSISMTLIAKSGSTYVGYARSILSKKTLSYEGTSSGGRISITATQAIQRDDAPFASRITITRTDQNQLRFIEELRNLDSGQQFVSMETVFQRQ